MMSALKAGLLTSISTSLIGGWVVLKGLSFFSDALAHGVLPGIAVAVILGINPIYGAIAATFFIILGINTIKNNTRLSDDVSIGLLFVGFLALAVVIMSSSSSYTGDLDRFLFGSITGVNQSDILILSITAVIIILSSFFLYRAFLVSAYDEIQAQLLNLKPKSTNYILLGLLSITIIASFKVVGNLLVFAFLIAPPATASLYSKSIKTMMVLSLILGAFSVILGLLFSYHYDTASSATMALVAVTIFIAALALTQLSKTKNHVS